MWQCRRLYNTAREQRITQWTQHSVTRAQHAQEADLKDLRTAMAATQQDLSAIRRSFTG